jgi:hypothetical protein
MEPFVEERVDLGAAIIASTMANINSKRHRYDIDSFMLIRRGVEKTYAEQEGEDREAIHMKAFILQMGGSL